MSGRKEKKSINLIGNSGKASSRKKIKAKKTARRKSPEPRRQHKGRERTRSTR